MYLLLIGAILLVCYFFTKVRSNRGRKLPPGPRPLPIIGNIRDFSPKGIREVDHWKKHKDLYGPVSCITALGEVIVFIHEKDAAHEILNMQAASCSDRPYFEFAMQMCGYGNVLPGQSPSKKFSRSRKLIERQMGTSAGVSQFHGRLRAQTHTIMANMLAHPGDILDILKR